MYDFTQIFGAIKEAFGFANKKTELNNTPAMQKAAQKQKELDEDAADAAAIKSGNEKVTRERLS